MIEPRRVGGDVDAFCTRCQLTLGHTILAMVGTRVARVRCNTCQGEHQLRGATPTSKRARDARTAATKARESAHPPDFDQLLEGKDISQPHRYSGQEIFHPGEVVHHLSFGLGIVTEIRGDRLDIVFRSGRKTLAQKRAHAQFAKRMTVAESNGREIAEPEEESESSSAASAE